MESVDSNSSKRSKFKHMINPHHHIDSLKSRLGRNKTTLSNNESVSTSKTGEIDTDDPEIRALRVENQHILESQLDQTYGLSLIDRMTVIRKTLFQNVPHVRGQNTSDLRVSDLSKGAGLIPLNYASADSMRNRFLPALDQFVTDLPDQIKLMHEPQRNEAAIHLASIIYTLGVPLHPYLDGNGQTLRLVALSYLHELAPKDFSDLYFPFKPTNTGDNLENNLQTPIIAVLYNLLYARQYSELELKQNWALRSGRIMDESENGFHIASETEMREMFPDEAEKERIRQLFEQGELIQNDLLKEIKGSHPSQTKIHLFLDYMLNTERGKNFMRNYVLHPDVQPIHDPEKTPWYLRTAEGFFSHIGQDIKDILEAKEVHESKFEEAKIQALTTFK